MILKKIISETRKRVEITKSNFSLDDLKKSNEFKNRLSNTNPGSFKNSIHKKNHLSFICEIKKASPSKGVISKNFPYLDIARSYKDGGAEAISVLTEPYFFMGSDNYLTKIKNEIDLPILRKDFIVDSYQIFESVLIGASAVLLIAEVLDRNTLKDYLELSADLGIDALVEVRSQKQAYDALEAGAGIIGVNNRNLRNFETDIGYFAAFRKIIPDNITFISESGVRDAADISFIRSRGADAVLIGEALMCSDKPAVKLKEFKSAAF